MSELPKTYDPKSVEDKLYKFWVDSGFFHAEVNPDKKPYTIVIPPPNVTGQLHMGHAFDETLQDILIRTKRMQGYEALWMPGTDHAGIATQIKVEENLRKEEGLTRYDLGREEFLKRVWAWKDKFGSRIISQTARHLLRLGPRALHHGRGLLQGGPRGIRKPVQQGPDLQGPPHHQLVPALRDRSVRR